MTVKLAVLLLAVAVLASLAARGRASRPKPPRRAVETARKCPSCGAWVVAGARCDCEGR
ncbi:hypothetical protein [Amaricoccus sp.]|uniref:hypothetical protein n=1 Tax=Amaricoccus sp. TaxID=1872485 RepID=UPI001B635998|nr:hypothetical protein [Amaricoccus sp.]MBP7000789.1 hypothetical protein [Amaricoccus sp.]